MTHSFDVIEILGPCAMRLGLSTVAMIDLLSEAGGAERRGRGGAPPPSGLVAFEGSPGSGTRAGGVMAAARDRTEAAVSQQAILLSAPEVLGDVIGFSLRFSSVTLDWWTGGEGARRGGVEGIMSVQTSGAV